MIEKVTVNANSVALSRLCYLEQNFSVERLKREYYYSYDLQSTPKLQTDTDTTSTKNTIICL